MIRYIGHLENGFDTLQGVVLAFVEGIRVRMDG